MWCGRRVADLNRLWSKTKLLWWDKKVGELERAIDIEYLNCKSLFVKFGGNVSCGAMVIFDELIEFMAQAAIIFSL